MAKASTGSSSGTSRPRRVTTSVESVIGRLEAIQRGAEQRQEHAGNLESAIEEGVRALSKAIEAFRNAGSVAEELQTLCRLVDNRDADTKAEETEASTRTHPDTGGR